MNIIVNISLYALMILCLNYCGIQVGNPHDDSDSQDDSSFSLSLSDAAVDDASNVYLNVTGALLLVDENLALRLNTSGDLPKYIDVLALNDGSVENIVNGYRINGGTYAGVILELDSENTGKVIKNDGTEYPLYLESKSNYISVEETIEISKNSTFDFNLHFDLRQSLSFVEDPDEGSYYLMQPVVTPLETSKASSIEVSFENRPKGIACLYPTEDFEELHSANEYDESFEHSEDTNEEFGVLNFTPPPKDERVTSSKPKKKRKPSIDQGQSSLACEYAVASGFIQGSKVGFYYIEAGEYELRVFADGKIYDYADLIVAEEGQKVEIDSAFLNELDD